MTAAQQRRAMAAGMAFVVLFVAGVLVTFANTPEIKSSDTATRASLKWVLELSSSSHRVGLIIAAYLLIVGAIAFVWFCNGLRELVDARPAIGRVISALSVLGAGAMGVAAMIGGAGIAGGVEFGEMPLPLNGEAIRVTTELFFPFLFVVFGLASAALIALATMSAARTAALPQWRLAGRGGVDLRRDLPSLRVAAAVVPGGGDRGLRARAAGGGGRARARRLTPAVRC